MEHPPQTTALAAVVETAIKAQGLTYEQIREATGIPLATLHRRLKGQSPFNVSEFYLLALLLDIPASRLLGQAEIGGAA